MINILRRIGREATMSITKYASLGAASLLAAAVFAGPALADGLPSRGRVASPEPPRVGPCSTTANVGFTTDYVFRGISQSGEDGAVQGGVDFACGRFYAGVWGSSINFSDGSEVDIYAGFKHSTGPVNWDFGVIYYSYPGFNDDLDYVELKVGASAEIWKGGTLGGTVYYSPDYVAVFGDSVTLEATFSQALPKVSIFSPTLGVTVGNVNLTDQDFDYTYWNVGLTLGFLEKWSLDLRYWDTNLNDDDCGGVAGLGTKVCDGRFVGTVKYTF
jgi:uncharacterized protein (TIGR02001 family)